MKDISKLISKELIPHGYRLVVVITHDLMENQRIYVKYATVNFYNGECALWDLEDEVMKKIANYLKTKCIDGGIRIGNNLDKQVILKVNEKNKCEVKKLKKHLEEIGFSKLYDKPNHYEEFVLFVENLDVFTNTIESIGLEEQIHDLTTIVNSVKTKENKSI
jgi:hypothetical protein